MAEKTKREIQLEAALEYVLTCCHSFKGSDPEYLKGRIVPFVREALIGPGVEDSEETRVAGSFKPSNIENVAGMAFFNVTSIEVNEWYRLPDGRGKPEQVHMLFTIEGTENPCILRFKSAPTLDQLIVNLITQRKRVFGDASLHSQKR